MPRNVARFEILLYISLMLDALSVAFQERTPTPDMTVKMITVETLLSGGLIVLLLYFVWLAAEKRKGWPRIVLAIVLLFSVMSLWVLIGERGMQFDSAIEMLSCALTALGLYYSFTGDARGWFDA